MNKVLVLGAGLVSKPLVVYLLEKENTRVTVATRTVSKAEHLIEGHANGSSRSLDIQNETELENLVREHDITISLVPYIYHTKVAKLCLKHKKHLVTTSYVSKEMAGFNDDAENAGLLFLNEIGLDPGIDHMSAMKIIDEIETSGGRVISFRSLCGGLPAPDANDNPWGYKFSWSPRGVLLAGRNNARWMEEGREIVVDSKDLFSNFWPIRITELGDYEYYPNRDSVPYIDTYNLHGIDTMFRGTIRNLGWCILLKKIADFGLLDLDPIKDSENLTYREMISRLTGVQSADIKTGLIKKFSLESYPEVIDKMEWLGLFDERKIGLKEHSPLDILVDLLQSKLEYKEGQRDMIILHHIFIAEKSGKKQKIESTLADFGIPGGDSSMARTVSLPAAIATGLILDKKINIHGVRIPVQKEIYLPVMKELGKYGIVFKDRVTDL